MTNRNNDAHGSEVRRPERHADRRFDGSDNKNLRQGHVPGPYRDGDAGDGPSAYGVRGEHQRPERAQIGDQTCRYPKYQGRAGQCCRDQPGIEGRAGQL